LFIFFEKTETKFFDKNTQPVGMRHAVPPEKITVKAKRRRYAHTFSAGRHLKLVRSVSGQNHWRLVPDGAVVHYGKQYSHNTKKRISKKVT